MATGMETGGMAIIKMATDSLYKSFFDNTLDGLAYCQMVFDKREVPVDFIFIKSNKNFEKLTGLKKVIGKKATELVPGIRTSNPELFEIYGHVSLTGEPQTFEVYVKPLQGWFFVSTYSPKKGFFVTIFQNITDRKQIEKDLESARIAARNVLEDLQVEKETLAHEKAKDEAMLASIGDGVIIVDPVGKITFVNQSAEHSLGWSSEEIIDKSLFDVVPIEDEKGTPISAKTRPMAMALALGATTAATVEDPTYYYVRKDKTKFPVAIMVTPVTLDKKIIGTIEVFRDITKEREIDRTKTEFVSLASHQLRTPLSSVRWYSDMLLYEDVGTVNEKQKQYLKQIQHGNLRMIGLVNTLLHVSKLELGMAQVTVESVRLSEVVAEVLRDLESRRQKQAVSVEAHIPDSLLPLMTDIKLIRIVIENLISNAIKYTGTDDMVKIAAQEVSAGESFDTRVASEKSVGLCVIDSGIGIPEESQAKVFTKLFRAENAREVDSDGTGLGLYLTRLALERLKGQIWFKSRRGAGTAFYVLLPYNALEQEKKRPSIIELI